MAASVRPKAAAAGDVSFCYTLGPVDPGGAVSVVHKCNESGRIVAEDVVEDRFDESVTRELNRSVSNPCSVYSMDN